MSYDEKVLYRNIICRTEKFALHRSLVSIRQNLWRKKYGKRGSPCWAPEEGGNQIKRNIYHVSERKEWDKTGQQCRWKESERWI